MGSIDLDPDMIPIKARSIAVIGAGPSGLIAAKYLQAEKAFDGIVLFEQRSRSGGIWNSTSSLRYEDLFTVPQKNPHGKNQNPTWRCSHIQKEAETDGDDKEDRATNGTHKDPTFLSPIYDHLETNIPRDLMRFTDLAWPKDSPLFPPHPTVLKYIQDYGADMQNLIRYETQVTNIQPTELQPTGSWTVQSRDLRTNEQLSEEFDAVIVANGHFITPYLPDIPGIRTFHSAYPDVISHAKYYRDPEEFRDKKVVVVGNSASGSDISSQIAEHAEAPLLWSSKSPSTRGDSISASKRELPPIAKFLIESRGVEFEDGTIEQNIDAVVFCTGYFYSLPFLENVQPKLIGDGTRVQHLYQHLFYIPRPTLSFLTLPQRIIPFPIAEAQAAVLARVYSGRLSVPPFADMQRWEEDEINQRGPARDFHLLPFPADGNYINTMSQWAMSAQLKPGPDDEGKGKIPPVWGEWEFWVRERFPKIRAAFTALGARRKGVRTLEEVGFSYEEHLGQQARGEGKLI